MSRADSITGFLKSGTQEFEAVPLTEEERQKALAEAQSKAYAYAQEYERAKAGKSGNSHATGELSLIWSNVALALRSNNPSAETE